MPDSKDLRRLKALKAELDNLTGQKVKALSSATYGGWTPEQVKEYEALRARILRVIEDILKLGKAEEGPSTPPD